MSLQRLVFIGLVLLMLGSLLVAWQLEQAAWEIDGIREAVVTSSEKAGTLFDRLQAGADDGHLPGEIAEWVNASARTNSLLSELHSRLTGADTAAARQAVTDLRAALTRPSPEAEAKLDEIEDLILKGGREDLRAAGTAVTELRSELGDDAKMEFLDKARARVSRGHMFAGASTVFALVLFVALYWAMAKLGAERQLIERDREAQRLRRVAYGDRARVLSSVNQLTEVFGETRDVNAVLDEAVRAIREILDVDNIVLELYGSEESKLRRHIVDGVAGDIDLGDEIYDDVIGRGQSRLINRLDSTGQYAGLAEKGYRSLLVTPLVRNKPGGEKEPIGFVAALCEKRRDFTTHDQWLLNTFARQASLIIENAQLYQKTQRMAMHDGLTNLYNHRRFREVLDSLLAEAAESNAPLGLIMGDIDHFKNYNDTHGHLKGDAVLTTVGDILRTNIRGADTAARYGGEECVVLLPGTDLHGCRLVGENLRARIQQHQFEGQEEQPGGNLTITFGLAMFPADGQ
ncbi:MAG: sensor domain-containing diguanylate cyclase, partial [Planctomycetota bacterium]